MSQPDAGLVNWLALADQFELAARMVRVCSPQHISPGVLLPHRVGELAEPDAELDGDDRVHWVACS